MSLARNICLALWGIALTASAALSINLKPAIPIGLRSRNGQDEPRDYRGWIDNALAKIDSDNAGEQHKAVEALCITIVDPAVQQKVLAALEPHLNGSDQDFRLRCITAYGHWATKDQVKQLQQVVASADTTKSVGGGQRCWAQAVGEMVSLDPDAAKAAMQQQMGNFFFRTALITLLDDMTLDNSPTQPAAFDLLKQLDPSNPFVKTSTGEAITLVKSDSAADRTKGATVLAHAVVTNDDRSEVLESLRPHINKIDRSAIPFIQAYSHWANQADIATLRKIVATDPAKEDINSTQDCWAAALIGLARLNPQAAADAAKSRADVQMFPSSVHHVFEPIAQGNTADSSVACWLIGLVDPQMGQPRIPPGFNPAPPKPAVPVGQGA